MASEDAKYELLLIIWPAANCHLRIWSITFSIHEALVCILVLRRVTVFDSFRTSSGLSTFGWGWGLYRAVEKLVSTSIPWLTRGLLKKWKKGISKQLILIRLEMKTLYLSPVLIWSITPGCYTPTVIACRDIFISYTFKVGKKVKSDTIN